MPPDPLENLLQHYRPAGPPDSLRQRILATPTNAAPRRWPLYLYRAAIAATLLLSLGLLQAAESLNQKNINRIGTGPVEWPPNPQAVADLLGPTGQTYITFSVPNLR